VSWAQDSKPLNPAPRQPHPALLNPQLFPKSRDRNNR
jgi:hypothetical protein